MKFYGYLSCFGPLTRTRGERHRRQTESSPQIRALQWEMDVGDTDAWGAGPTRRSEEDDSPLQITPRPEARTSVKPAACP